MKKRVSLLLIASTLFASLTCFAQGKYIELHLTGILPEIEKKLLPGDVIKSGTGYNNITLRLRNTNQKNWTLSSGNIYAVQFDSVSKHYKLDLKINISKESKWYTLDEPVIICVLAHTAFDNYIWTEITRSADKLTEPIVLDQYSGTEGNSKAPLKGAGTLKVTPAAIVKAPPAEEKTNSVELKQHGTKIELASKPDTVENGLLKASLAKDATVRIGLQELHLQSGQPVVYNPVQGFVVSATLKGDQPYKTAEGTILLKGGSPVQFYRFRLKSCTLAQDAVLAMKQGTLYAKSNIHEEGDLLFGEDGNIEKVFIAQPFEIKPSNEPLLLLPAYSSLSFRNNQITEVGLSNDVAIMVDGKRFNLAASPEASIRLDGKTGAVEEALAAKDQFVELEGIRIPVKERSKITFTTMDDTLMVHKFYIGAEMQLKEWGKKGPKEVKVKSGRRLTIKEGKIVDISRF
jgi:hypothetical protein